MKKSQIKNRLTDAVMFEGEYESLKQFVEFLVREKKYLDGANLRGANLRGANLRGAYLGGAYLDGANLDGANLGGANLHGAYLDGAYLDGANLRGANLRGANLDGAYLDGAYLDGAYLDGANLDGANLRGAYLDGAYLYGAYLYGATNYSSNHNFFQEVIRRQPQESFTTDEWSLIGKLLVHWHCWDWLTQTENLPHIKTILAKLTVAGFDEFEKTLNDKTGTQGGK